MSLNKGRTRDHHGFHKLAVHADTKHSEVGFIIIVSVIKWNETTFKELLSFGVNLI